MYDQPFVSVHRLRIVRLSKSGHSGRQFRSFVFPAPILVPVCGFCMWTENNELNPSHTWSPRNVGIVEVMTLCKKKILRGIYGTHRLIISRISGPRHLKHPSRPMPGASCAKDRRQQSGNNTKAERERITPDLRRRSNPIGEMAGEWLVNEGSYRMGPPR